MGTSLGTIVFSFFLEMQFSIEQNEFLQDLDLRRLKFDSEQNWEQEEVKLLNRGRRVHGTCSGKCH